MRYIDIDADDVDWHLDFDSGRNMDDALTIVLLIRHDIGFGSDSPAEHMKFIRVQARSLSGSSVDRGVSCPVFFSSKHLSVDVAANDCTDFKH